MRPYFIALLFVVSMSSIPNLSSTLALAENQATGQIPVQIPGQNPVQIPAQVLPPKTKPNPSGSPYMTQGKAQTFSAKVKVVRTIQGETEVFFESEKAHGAYLLPSTLKGYAGYLEALELSRKPGGPQVKVKADEEKRIQNVILEEKKDPSNQEFDWDKI